MRLSEQLNLINRFLQSAPVDLETMANSIGLKVHYAYLAEGISGMLERVKNTRSHSSYKATVNALDPRTRQRFTLAHEIGHYMLHRHLVGDGLDDDRAYRSTEVGRYHNTDIGPHEETQANQFAACLIMPKPLVDVHRDALGDDVAEMAKLFQVSKQAMSIRLGVPY